MGFTDDQIFSLVVLERTGGALSLFAVCSIFLAYALFPKLRTVPNTFIVFASVANAGASIASIIAYDGMYQGTVSPLCQAQGFMFEMFIQSDPWWSLAMAVNVLMVFFGGANPQSIKKWGWLYCLVCYGGPFIIALVCLLLRAPDKGLVYGSAGLWCWISNDWNPLRIYSYYMLIWICIVASMIVYVGIGYYVFRARNRLNQFTNTTSQGRETTLTNHNGTSDKSQEWPLTSDTHESMYGNVNVVTEVRVTRSDSLTPPASPFPQPPKTYAPEKVTLAPHPTVNPTGISTTVTSKPRAVKVRPGPRSPSQPRRRVFHRLTVLDPVKRAYLRTSFLFAVSVLVTWIPSSVNRIHGLLYSDSPYPYNVATATVLPLQGVWNAIIFFVTSHKVLSEAFRDWRRRRTVVELMDLQENTVRRGAVVGGGRMPGGEGVWRHVKYEDVDYGSGKQGGAVLSSKEREIDGKDSWDFADIGREGSDVELRGTSISSKRSY